MARGPQAQNTDGLPPNTKLFSPFPFSGMNTQASPVAISDQEFVWLENFVRLGDGKLRTVWDAGTPLYQVAAPRSIIAFFAFSLGTTLYFAAFLDDGSAYQVTWPTGAVTRIGPPNTFYNGATKLIPEVSQYGVQYLLISNRNTINDYWAWDGTLLYGAGTVAPNGVVLTSGGSNYNTPPTIQVFGGHGNGVSLQPVVNAGSVVNVNILAPGSGFEVGDIAQLQFSGGGSDTGPILVANLNAGGVAAANVTAPGSNYTTASVAITGGGGSGATGTAIIGAGAVTLITVSNPGSGYTHAGVSFAGGGGTGATASANIIGGQIASIDVITGGSGYSGSPTVTVTGDGSGATAAAQTDAGEITGITITNPGSGYTTAPSIAISGNGTGALAVAILASGAIQGVTVVNPGSGFTEPPLITFVGGGSPNLIASGITTVQPTSVAHVNVISGGQDYISEPTVSFLGGPLNAGASNAQGKVIQANGEVVAVNVTNGGSGNKVLPNVVIIPASKDPGNGAVAQAVLAPVPLGNVVMTNYGSGYTTAPAVEVSPGANNAAYGTITLMPFGLSGSCMETFQSRVWIANPAPSPFDTLPPGGDFAVTSASSITNVATSSGGVLFTNTDSFLQTRYVAIKQSNGYLYFIGDGSVSVVSGVTTSAANNEATTTFNYQTVDPQVGGSWRDAVQDFGRNILIANEVGLFSISGGSAIKVSDKMDDVFLNATFPSDGGTLVPSGAVAHLFEVKHYLMLATVQDPDTLASRNVMLTWNGREWSITSQTPNLTFITTQKRGSELFAWGTDGTAIYPLFNTPNPNLTKRIETKQYGANQPFNEKDLLLFWMQAQDQSANGAGVACSLSFVASGVAEQETGFQSTPSTVYVSQTFAGQGDLPLIVSPPNFAAPKPFWPIEGTAIGGLPFMNLGLRLTTTSPDFVLSHLLLGYNPGPAQA